MEGSRRRRCIGGEFDGNEPECIGLNQIQEFDVDSPPTVLFRFKSGYIAQSNDGQLVRKS